MNRGQAAVLAALLGVVAIGAQAKVKDEKGSWKGDEHKRRWVERVGLSEAQADKLEGAFKEQKKAVKPLRRELRDATTKLRDQVEDEAGDEAIKGTLERLRKAKRAMLEERERFHAKVSELLPPTQSAKLLLARGRLRQHAFGGEGLRRLKEIRMQRRRGGHGGHRGRRGGDREEDEERLRDSIHEEERVEEQLDDDDDDD